MCRVFFIYNHVLYTVRSAPLQQGKLMTHICCWEVVSSYLVLDCRHVEYHATMLCLGGSSAEQYSYRKLLTNWKEFSREHQDARAARFYVRLWAPGLVQLGEGAACQHSQGSC